MALSNTSMIEDFQAALNQQRANMSGDPWDEDDKDQLFGHHTLFASIINILSKTYSYRFDEAMRNIPANALAMRRDAYIQSLLEERFLPTVHRSWDIVVEEPKNPKQIATAKTLKKAIKKLPRFRRMIRYLLEAVWYGRYGAKLYWEELQVGGVPFWLPSKHNPVNGDKIQTRFDDGRNDFLPVIFVNPMFLGRYPQDAIVYTDRVPGVILNRPEWRNQFIIHRHLINDADYFEVELSGGIGGIGVRNFIYWAWWLRDELLSWCIDYMQKVGTLGLLIFWYESGNKEGKAKAEQNAQDSSRSSALTMPVPAGKDGKTWGVEQLQAGTAGIQALQTMIMDYFEHHMERLIIGQTLSSGTEGSGLGGSGVASLHMDTKFNILKFDAENLAETMTEDLLNPIIGANRAILGEIDYDIRFEFNVEKPENDKTMDTVQKASSMGVTFKMDDVRDLTGMEKPEDGDEIIGGQQQNPMGGFGQPGMDGLGMGQQGMDGEGDILDELLQLAEKLRHYRGGKNVHYDQSSAWKPHTIQSGPHKGKSAYKHSVTGEIRDQPPEGANGQGTEQPEDDSKLPPELTPKVKGVIAGLKERIQGIKSRLKYFATNTLVNLYQFREDILQTAEDFEMPLWSKESDALFHHTGISSKDAWVITKLLIKKMGKVKEGAAHVIDKVKKNIGYEWIDEILQMYEDEDSNTQEQTGDGNGSTEKAKAKAVRELLEIHAHIWDFPTDQIPSEEEILAHMNGQDNQT